LFLSGCPISDNPGTGSISYAPYPSNIAQDTGGQKYFVANVINTNNLVVAPPKALFAWDAGTLTWVKKSTFTSDVGLNEIYADSNGDIWLNNFSLLSVTLKPVIRINTQTLQTSTYSLGINRFMVDGDVAVEYKGTLVNSYQPTTGTSVYLHSLPTPSVAAQGMGITLNTQPYQMLCVPVLKYFQWDGKTHYCMLANSVKYATDLPLNPDAANNDVIEFIVSVTNAGNTYQLLNHFQTPLVAILQNYPAQENFTADYPMFSSLVKSGCTGSVDKQGNYHQFCDDTGDSTRFTYRFYDKANPTTPLYQQVLP
jgi:hypothetical protein